MKSRKNEDLSRISRELLHLQSTLMREQKRISIVLKSKDRVLDLQAREIVRLRRLNESLEAYIGKEHPERQTTNDELMNVGAASSVASTEDEEDGENKVPKFVIQPHKPVIVTDAESPQNKFVVPLPPPRSKINLKDDRIVGQVAGVPRPRPRRMKGEERRVKFDSSSSPPPAVTGTSISFIEASPELLDNAFVRTPCSVVSTNLTVGELLRKPFRHHSKFNYKFEVAQARPKDEKQQKDGDAFSDYGSMKGDCKSSTSSTSSLASRLSPNTSANTSASMRRSFSQFLEEAGLDSKSLEVMVDESKGEGEEAETSNQMEVSSNLSSPNESNKENESLENEEAPPLNASKSPSFMLTNHRNFKKPSDVKLKSKIRAVISELSVLEEQQMDEDGKIKVKYWSDETV